MQTRTLSTLVAVFATDAEARLAANDLRQAGIDTDNIYITAANTTDTNENVGREYRRHEGGIKGWFHSLFGENQDETNAAATRYEDAVNTGNVLLSVETNEENMDTAADILNRHSPIDVHRDASTDDFRTDTRTDTRFNDGRLAGAEAGRQELQEGRGIGIPETAPTAMRNTAAGVTGSAGSTTRNAARDVADASRNAAGNASQAIPVVREELKVGKRAILRGGVRVYSRVVEQPVEETIGLREEHVRVDRTPVNREVTDADLRTRDRQVIEVKEYAEEPVVSKTARVVEEVRVRKEATERNETVRDTVRNTEVNVENLGSNAGSAQTGGAGDNYSADFQRDFNQRYGTSGETYDTYAPAYTYGYQMANDPRYRGRNFNEVENDLRTDYQRRYPNSTWERMKDSVRYGWDRLTNRA